MNAGRSQFASRVLRLVSLIPPGRVATYGDLARLAGRPRAARAVGALMRAAPRDDLPYHRVVAAGGRLGGYGGREAFKRDLLRAEGVPVVGQRIRQFEQHRWKGQRKEGKGQKMGPTAASNVPAADAV
ncbi:MAG: methylated-DNA--[protein]-cysteine S-methyltransferase [Acidobacteria bacterium]|nr:methylated-DNA--[protein]-cysteine S-methyltransferase [Acidobacteriota bacterium]